MTHIPYWKICRLLLLLFLIPGNTFGQDDPMGLFDSSPRGQVLWMYTSFAAGPCSKAWLPS